jgi:hypothetical protein
VNESVTLLLPVTDAWRSATVPGLVAGGGAAALTMIVATALCPSLVTVIWVVPALTAVTRPSELTEAIAGFALDDVTTRPVSAFPLASRAVTWS